MTRTRDTFAVAAFIVLLAFGTANCSAQVDWIAETGSYSVDENWSSGIVPDREGAEIWNGGTAFIDDAPPEVAELIIGRTAFGGHGTVEIHSGGELFATGLVHVGGSDFNAANGFGQLRVFRGGELVTLDLTSGGERSSAIVLGEGEGPGTSKLTVDEKATLSRNTRIIGPNVEFSPVFLEFTAEHTLIAEIIGAEHSTISVEEDVTLNDSALHVEFNGYTPAFDDSWTLIDAFLTEGEFGALTASGLPPGGGVFLSYGDGGENGEIVDLSVGTQLALSIDRRTGNVAIQNQAEAQSVSITGYAIDGIDGANSSASITLDPNSGIDLGDIYDFTPSAIGEVGPDVTFEYEDGGETIAGRVEMSGPHNNIVLLVDSETGAVAIQNQSVFDVDVDGYLVTSSSGSLDAETWLSFQDSGQAEWGEANPSAAHLAELNLNASLSLGANGQPMGIGSPFDFDAEGVQQDLAFEFHLAGGDTVTGVVEYGSLDIGTTEPLDCNGDGVVDAGDLGCVNTIADRDAVLGALGTLPGDLDGDGEVAFADFLTLSGNFGNDPATYPEGNVDLVNGVGFSDFLTLSGNFGKTPGAAASVPEPTGWIVALLSLIALPWRSSGRLTQSFSVAVTQRHRSLWERSDTVASGRRCTSEIATNNRNPLHRLPRLGSTSPKEPKGRGNKAPKLNPRAYFRVTLGSLAIVIASAFANSVDAQTLTPAKQIFVSDTSDRDMINEDMDAGPLDDDGDIVARERLSIDQDNLQIRTFIEFDLSSITAEQAASPGWSATFQIDFVTRLNTVNDLAVVIGRVLDKSHPETEDGNVAGDSWTTEPGSLPLFEWGRTTGESTAPEFEEDRIVVVQNIKTDPLGTRDADVTSIVANWVNGVFENNGFSVAGDIDAFQGAGLNNARLVVGLAGDFNGDGIVDLADFLILSDNFAAHLDGPVVTGDIDFDGDVDLDDFGQFKVVFSAAQVAAPAESVPEPASMLLATLGFLSILSIRRQR